MAKKGERVRKRAKEKEELEEDEELIEKFLSSEGMQMMEAWMNFAPMGFRDDGSGWDLVRSWQKDALKMWGEASGLEGKEGISRMWGDVVPEGWYEKVFENAKEMGYLFPLGYSGVFTEENLRLYREWLDLCIYYQKRIGGEVEDAEVSGDFDKRFSGESWKESWVHDMLRRSYVIMSRWWHDTAVKAMSEDESLSDGDRRRLEFNLGLFLGALSPSNFALTNPEVIEETLSTKGQNLVRGMENFVRDVVENKGQWRVATVNEEAFDVGVNLAVTPGEVIYSTPLFELIQYSPSRSDEMREPLLIVPPVINKYYILDMQEKNSFVKWAVGEGLSVFMMSWVNPTSSLREKGFGDYVLEIGEALRVVQEETGADRVHTLGYCVGGTMLSSYLAYRAKELGVKDNVIASATLLTCLVDFSDAGEIKVFLNEEQMASIEVLMKEKGYFDAYVMASSFSLLRANDLIWSFVVNNYLLGKEPPPFDLLYWNSDSTNLTESFFKDYMDVGYVGNKLCQKNEVEIGGVMIDVGEVKVPVCCVASEEDHIAPWKSCFASSCLFSGEKTFVLGGSGHVNGMINPPAKNKYYYRSGEIRDGDTGDEWRVRAEEEKGSWWNFWRSWLEAHSEGKVKSRGVGRSYSSRGKAPGTYVLRRS